MKSNQNSNENFRDLVNRNKKAIPSDSIENLNYLYPNGHRITHQMRWFKGSKDRGLQSDFAAWKKQIGLLYSYKNEMRKTKKNNPEPYEDMLRLDKLDPYEAQIKSNNLLKQINKPKWI